ncbi:MAG TPA: ubiquitin-like domain-containing protein [Anaerolineales bacterium]|nr:ubiquitin-like domain-containing protein [Anaerolineales bacterium]
MKPARLLALALAFSIIACQPAARSAVTIVEDKKVTTLQADARVLSALLDQAGITLDPNDRVLLNGLPATPNHPITQSPNTLQIRRAVNFTIVTPDGEQQVRSSAFTVGEALQEASIWLYAGDKVEPELSTPLTEGMKITITAPRELIVSVGGKMVQIQSSARTVGEALAEAGIPLIGMDYSLPAEKDPLPSDGQIRLVRVSESVILAQKLIPFEKEFQASADVPIDQTAILQPGENGLSAQRIRIRYEDGMEVSRLTEEETLIRPPQKRIMAYGTKIEVKTTVVGGVTIEYWRAMQMWATSYSPCRSGGDRCYSGTSSGKSLRKGMVGLRPDLYRSLQGQRLYIPGYGFATVEDVCGGCVGKPWIDLGYSDDDFETWGSMVTVYFLTPVPANIPYDLQ